MIFVGVVLLETVRSFDHWDCPLHTPIPAAPRSMRGIMTPRLLACERREMPPPYLSVPPVPLSLSLSRSSSRPWLNSALRLHGSTPPARRCFANDRCESPHRRSLPLHQGKGGRAHCIRRPLRQGVLSLRAGHRAHHGVLRRPSQGPHTCGGTPFSNGRPRLLPQPAVRECVRPPTTRWCPPSPLRWQQPSSDLRS